MLNVKAHYKWMIVAAIIAMGFLLLFGLKKQVNSPETGIVANEVAKAESTHHNTTVAMMNQEQAKSKLASSTSNSPHYDKKPVEAAETKLKTQTSPPKTNTQEQLSRSEERKEQLKKYERLTEAASEKNWDKFLRLSEDVLAMSEYAKHSTLTAAIRDKAPKYVFEMLISRGAQFQSQHVMRAVMLDNLSFLKMLISLGLDIHVTGPDGGNAVNAVVRTLASRKVLDFLLVSNVEIKAGNNGVYPLSEALDKSLTNAEAVYYVYKLVQHGASISDGDLQVVEKIRKENQRAYSLIERNVPELIK